MFKENCCKNVFVDKIFRLKTCYLYLKNAQSDEETLLNQTKNSNFKTFYYVYTFVMICFDR